MKVCQAKIIDPIGIHARPASLIVSVASKFKAKVTIKVGKKVANAKSVINLMALGAKCDAEIELVVEGEDEDAAFVAVRNVMVNEKLI